MRFALCALAFAAASCGGGAADDRPPFEGPEQPWHSIPRVEALAELVWIDVKKDEVLEPTTNPNDEDVRPSVRSTRKRVTGIRRAAGDDRDDGSVLRFEARVRPEREAETTTLVVKSGKDELARFEASLEWSTFELAWPRKRGVDVVSLDAEVMLANPRTAREDENPRTVVLFTSDTHRADHVSSIHPDSPIATPHIDALGREGAVFTNCFTAANNTNPSHIALMTGVHPRDVKIVNNRTPLHDSATTLAELYRDAGYATYAVMSAFHLTDSISGLGQGFDRMNTIKGTHRDGEVTLDIARRWLDESAGEPVFLWIHVFDAHSPYEISKEIEREMTAGLPDPRREDASLEVDSSLVPAWLRDTGIKDPDYVRALYAGEVRYLDGHLGEFLQLPRVKGATFAFTADHGEGLGEQQVWWSHFGVLTPMVHVPLVLRGPTVEPGMRTNAAVRQIDVGRTLLDLSGMYDAEFPGTNVLLKAGSGDVADPRFAISGHGLAASIEQGGWMLEIFLRNARVPSSGRSHPFGSCVLFELATDPLCEDDVLLENFERAKRMREALIGWLEAAEATGLNSETYQVSEETAAKLAELGYSEGVEAMLRWWVPEGVDPEWASNPWNLAFQGDGDPSLLEQ